MIFSVSATQLPVNASRILARGLSSIAVQSKAPYRASVEMSWGKYDGFSIYHPEAASSAQESQRTGKPFRWVAVNLCQRTSPLERSRNPTVLIILSQAWAVAPL